MKLLNIAVLLSCVYTSLAFNCEFRLFTRANLNTHQVITAQTVAYSYFNSDKESKFIVHGWKSNADVEWMAEMKDELLVHGDYNVFLVDWRDGASNLIYDRSADNTDETGRQMYDFILLLKQHGHHENKCHLIGHSLGAQSSGAAGKRIPTVKRITGLDPAGPSFDSYDNDKKLDASDAQFVDIIHTDANTVTGLGCWNPSGHVDFYPNGGKSQPGCGIFNRKKRDVSVDGDIGCDHGRAHEYFTESINVRCTYQSYPCGLGDECYSCGNRCNKMGFHATIIPSGIFYLETNSARPFCQY
ncbi:inactive pancreatic lipase-related protein 1-like [Glandiceps talaboti]